MLVFVTSVKHPNNSQSYEKVWRLLNNTLYSVCSQLDTDFLVVVVCDKQLPLFHHRELIEKYTEFVEVDFPSHGENVLNDFDRLGNLSSPIRDLQFWDNPSSQRGTKTENAISEGEASLMANYMLNRGAKQLIGILASQKYIPEYVCFFDADDYVGNDISAYVNSHPGENGWLMTHGYKLYENLISPFYKVTTFCGTGTIFNYSLLLEGISPNLNEASTQNEIFQYVNSEFLVVLARHGKIKSYFQKKNRPLLDFPFGGVANLVGHKESNEFIRRTIKGESVSVRLEESQKFSKFEPISSALVGYFNILPSNSQKVFCLGFQKTGTSSVEWLLKDMGYQVSSAYKQPDVKLSQMLESGDLSELRKVSELFDAFQDIPWFNYYKEFDQWYPGSKFILTIRESRSWWASFLHYFRTESYPLFKYIYGHSNPVGHEKDLVARYEKHNHDVMEYFKDRPDDLLVVDVSEKDALQKLSDFLGKETSHTQMPHRNATLSVPHQIRANKVKFKRRLKKILRMKVFSIFKAVTFSAPPIIVGGSKMSGIDLLMSILSCHPDIHSIGNLEFNQLRRHPFLPDRTVCPSPTNTKNTHPINLQKLLNKPISLAAKRWCGSSPNSIMAYERLIQYYGNNIRILNVVRDGRDVVSENERRTLAKQIVGSGRWVYDVKMGIEFDEHPQFLTVRYEDLVDDYERTINKICEFIEVQDVAPFHKYPACAKRNPEKYWIGKWRQPYYSDQVENLIRTPGAQECLQHYGYLDLQKEMV